MGTSRRDAIRMGFLTAAGVTTLKTFGPLAAVPAASAADGVAFDAFLRLDGIPGDSTDADHPGEIVVQSYSFGVANTGSSAPGGGAGQGKATFTDLALTVPTSSASPQLMVACASGKHFPGAVLTLRRAGAERFEFQTIMLEEVVVSGYQHAGATAGDVPHETITLGFATIEMEYTSQTASGGAGPVSSGGWDLRQNQPSTA